ncbi:hypothetical protein AB6A40_002812 [Gnathostoma spinigerum]|uniref:Uncharacterized protein n=1 Tax=Gnathostoma spinigerum TaxID=75299 RepID=A0ABD6E7N9_9BILA
MRRVVFSPYIIASSVESESVIQNTYKAPLRLNEIVFAIGYFNYQASSAISDTSIRVLSTRKTAPHTPGFVMYEAREMISTMEENFGRSLFDTDLCFLVVPGTNIFKPDPIFAVIGTENMVNSSPFILWKVIRESVVMKWFVSTTAASNEKMIIDDAISYLVGSLVSARRIRNSESWVSAVLSEQLRNALPLELDERVSYTGIEAQFSVTSPGHVMEVISNLIGKKSINEALYTFLLNVRQKRSSSLLKTMENAFLQQGKKDWCGRPFNVTDFFTQSTGKPWLKSGVSVRKLLHVDVHDRNGLSRPSSAGVPSGSPSEDTYNHPPVPIFIRSLNDSDESVIWQSQECGTNFSLDEEYVMTLINTNDVILRVGSPRQLRITYEESGPLGYPTALSMIYSQKTKVSTDDQLTFAADRLHLLLY